MSSLRVVPRRTWGGKDIQGNLPRVKYPADKIFYAFVFAERKHGPRPGALEIECVEYLQRLQNWDMRRKKDIRFNFVIAPDGNIYRGRGWNNAPFLPHKHKEFNYTSFYIGYLGDFRYDMPAIDHLYLRRNIVQFGIENKYISERFIEINLRHTLIPLLFDELVKIN
ncbi:peptidoglycan-recognition protein SB2-like [Macrosteles quadrilineatus]|uniref:peptidoglycan-recognition protein SB2-like n=1 Tax=Macrosteles quadrilineatus TaxID=74068 RepID=UPI0023E18BC6|nr:peptidoglycan-recognition protein SB2-like [Macrosteles quadrilineatus]XP_054261933.1 peptidoglycan-recognition protein SB2-like [Macrosteles quadrilineatus]